MRQQMGTPNQIVSPAGGVPCYSTVMPSISEIKTKNKEVGEHFFDDSTMNFFESKISNKTFGNYFVTSECGPSGLRRYTVREFNPNTGSIKTHGLFQEFDTLREAQSVAKKASKQTI